MELGAGRRSFAEPLGRRLRPGFLLLGRSRTMAELGRGGGRVFIEGVKGKLTLKGPFGYPRLDAWAHP